MNFLVVMILNDPDIASTVLQAWEQAGATGATIIESTGLGELRRGGLRDDMPLFPSLSEITRGEEAHHRTLFSVVKDQATVDEMVRISQELAGDLDEPNSGFLFVVPVLQAYGLNLKPDE